MKFRCTCGEIIPDEDYEKMMLTTENQVSEASETKDRLLPSLITTLWDSIQDHTRILYQCDHCGRIFINDKSGKLHIFDPAQEDTPRTLLSSFHQKD